MWPKKTFLLELCLLPYTLFARQPFSFIPSIRSTHDLLGTWAVVANVVGEAMELVGVMRRIGAGTRRRVSTTFQYELVQ